MWDGAPEGLKGINPSFDFVDHKFITGYVTELGIIKPDEIEKTLQESYQWLF